MIIPAITDFRAKGTIMGPTGLTAVFGMGTGVTPPVWSPEISPAGCQAAPAKVSFRFAGVGHITASHHTHQRGCTSVFIFKNPGPSLGPWDRFGSMG